MQGFQTSVHDQSPGLPYGILRRLPSFFTSKRLLYLLAATVLGVAAIALLTSKTAGVSTPQSKTRQFLVGAPQSDNPAAPESPSSATPATTDTTLSTTNDGSTSASLNVNGRNIPLPADGTTHQTTIDGNGSHTTVSSTSNQSSVTNSSVSSISVQVNSNGSSTGASDQ